MSILPDFMSVLTFVVWSVLYPINFTHFNVCSNRFQVNHISIFSVLIGCKTDWTVQPPITQYIYKWANYLLGMKELCGLHWMILMQMACWIMVRSDETVCYSESVEHPIAEKSGDYIIAGIFNVGELKEVTNK